MTSEATPTAASSERKVLLAYFSRPGENYYYGGRRTLKVGNTEVLARMIADSIDCDIYRIEASDPYPEDYEETVARNVREEQSGARPKIAHDLPSLEGYDTVLLGSPVWNVQTPMIMRSFAESLQWSNKRLHPFVTYAVSGLGSVVSDYRASAQGAAVSNGLAVQGEKVEDAGDAVQTWIGDLRLPPRR